ncbi:MAG TPA: neutral/alkaline non-lysosomal ceramidase N-terminal domain-containing protein [Bryobacteraceae bacterium]|nr:neutral/alkaline non-lysosomal ceramidase N-terminal domain-containing protein [Bryobacteraceae bacterium]
MRKTLLLLFSITCSLHAAWQAGAAAVDITPTEPIWLAGYAARTKPSEAVRRPIHVKALALKDDSGALSVAVTLDLVGFRREMIEPIAARAAKELHIEREHLLFNASHTHSAPLTGDTSVYAGIMGVYREKQQAVVARYTERLPGLIYEAIAKSVANLRPAAVSYGVGEAGFAVNRRRLISRDYPGPVDPDVPVLAARGPDGSVIALLFGYACHNTIMDDYTVHGDYAGYAQQELEQRFPGAVALFVQGAGADANPLPRRKAEHLQRYGATLADAVEQVVAGRMKPLAGRIQAAIEFPQVSFQGPFDRSRWLEEAASKEKPVAAHGNRMLAILDRGDKIPESRPYAVEVWRMGDALTLIALSGELTVDYALRFKSQYGAATTWVAGYSNDVFGYIPSLRVWKEGGYEGGEAFRFSNFPGRFSPDIEDRISEAVKRTVAKVRAE